MAATNARSKKRSDANYKPPEEIVFFIDRALGNRVVAQALRSSGEKVEIHADHFKSDEQDSIWLSEVGRRNWVVLTKDANIRYNSLERAAILNSKVRAFVLVGGNSRGEEMAKIFANALKGINRILKKTSGPFIAKVYRDGRVALWLHPETGIFLKSATLISTVTVT